MQDNAQGGFGTFQIVEARLGATLQTLPFDKLVQASHFLLTQNLGSNNLQLGLEEYIYGKFPPINRDFSLSKFVLLLKSVSGYQFKYREGCLQQLLENVTIKTISHMSLEQLEETLWSWGRSSRGTKELWEQLQFHVLHKIGLLKPRGVCFAYWSFSRAPHHMDEVMDRLEEVYTKL
ncbi:MAG: hypothetical protein JST59_00170 [Actinobacteria bacterium]|nr:hypothetical protein [Actinomycetota bacterium]